MQDTIQITINGKAKDLKMTFGLLNEMARTIEDVDNVPLLAIDADLREKALIALLSERDERGRITEEFNLFTIDASPEEILDLLDWAGAHVTDFFLKSLEKAKVLMDGNMDRIKALTPTSTGGAS